MKLKLTIKDSKNNEISTYVLNDHGHLLDELIKHKKLASPYTVEADGQEYKFNCADIVELKFTF